MKGFKSLTKVTSLVSEVSQVAESSVEDEQKWGDLRNDPGRVY